MTSPRTVDRDLMSLGDQEFLPRLFASVQDGILIIDSNNVVVFVNDAYTGITGVRRQEIIGRPLKEVRPGAQLPDVVETGRSKLGCYRKEGEVEYIVDMFPIQAGSRIVGGISIVWDITRIRRLVQSLEQNAVVKPAELRQPGGTPRASYFFDDIIFKPSGVMHDVIDFARRAASGDASVLITGESGTGKELLAHSIHNASQRRGGPFIPMNCSAFPAQLLESELFGYSDGAFTGARKGGKAGLLKAALRGTVFFDEIGDMNLELQAKLLRVLQERKVRSIGSDQEIPVDIRIISATNKDLRQLIRDKTFREDLFYRVNVLPIHIPPLRERREDVPLLVDHYCRILQDKLKRPLRLEAAVLETLTSYPWPGNIRELYNSLEFMAYYSHSATLSQRDLPPTIRDFDLSRESIDKYLANLEKELLVNTINRCGWNYLGKQKAAKELQISLATIYNRIKKFGLSKPLE